MERGREEQIQLFKEEGILQKSGKGFYTPSEFAVDHLFYVAWVGRYLVDSRYSVTRDYLGYYSLFYVVSGKMKFIYEGKTYYVSENEAMLIDFRKPHYYRAMTNRVDRWEIIFNGREADAFYDLIVGKWGNTFKVHGRIKGILENLLNELDGPLPDDLEVSMLFHMLFTYVVKDRQMKLSEPIRKALDYMTEYATSSLRITEVADYVGLSRSYFSRLFTKETGQTPYEYLLELRINQAKQLLSLTDVQVSEVAEKCGFVNMSHFIRVFREKTGSTPSAFRNFFNMEAARKESPSDDSEALP
ncbi:MAG: helix-turn-helix domain-containing protein [Oscillospiraceae bacterium]|nr:helix-turn-helix domain-containing protein [Oscillospiraceae bacterium]